MSMYKKLTDEIAAIAAMPTDELAHKLGVAFSTASGRKSVFLMDGNNPGFCPLCGCLVGNEV